MEFGWGGGVFSVRPHPNSCLIGEKTRPTDHRSEATISLAAASENSFPFELQLVGPRSETFVVKFREGGELLNESTSEFTILS